MGKELIIKGAKNPLLLLRLFYMPFYFIKQFFPSRVAVIMGIRYLKSKKHPKLPSMVATISFFGIMLGVATLIIVTSIMNGFRIELITKIIGLNSHLTIYSKKNNYDDERYNTITKQLASIPEVSSYYKLIEGQGMMVNKKRGVISGALVKGIEKDVMEDKRKSFEWMQGDLEAFDNEAVVIGSTLSSKLNIDVNDPVSIISPEVNETVMGLIPRIKTYRVAAIVSTGMQQYDEVIVFMSLKSTQKFYNLKDRFNTVEVNMNNPADALTAGADLRKKLPDSRVYDWQTSNFSLINALTIEKNVMLFILTLFVIVAMFSISASLVLMINDKRKNIAITLAMGLDKSDIVYTFFITGFSVALAGMIAGNLGGYWFATHVNTIKNFLENILQIKLLDGAVYFLSYLPAKLDRKDTVLINVITLTFAIGATILPALRASKCNPSEALKYF